MDLLREQKEQQEHQEARSEALQQLMYQNNDDLQGEQHPENNADQVQQEVVNEGEEDGAIQQD